MTEARTTDLTDDHPATGSRWVGPMLYAAATAVYAAALHLEKIRLPLELAVRQSATFWLSLAGVMTLVDWVDRRIPPTRAVTPRAVMRELVTAVAAVATWLGLIALVNWYELGPLIGRAYSNWMFQGLFDGSVYGCVRGLTLVAASWREQRAQERREAALLVAAREAELAAIKTQFQPHFVLNALTSTLALIDHDPALARTMIVRLADLMRSVFDRADVAEVPLERELDLVRAYLDVERIRLGARLTVRFDIEDAVRGVLVPPFLLQPIVENAVKHGVAPFARPGAVEIGASRITNRVRVTVTDSGPAVSWTRSQPPSTGLGLSITRRRLETMYGTGFQMTIDRAAGGTSVRLDLPAEPRHVA